MASKDYIDYEFPLNERTRLFLRIEEVFNRINHFFAQSHSQEHHIVMLLLIELTELCQRADLKAELLMTLDYQANQFTTYLHHPLVDQNLLNTLLQEIHTVQHELINSIGIFGQDIRQNDMITSLKKRSVLIGGPATFDIPIYHHWLNRSAEERYSYLLDLIGTFKPLYEAIRIVLRLLRSAPKMITYSSNQNGYFEYTLAGQMVDLLSVRMNQSESFFPDLSANKYCATIQFMHINSESHLVKYQEQIAFKLVLYQLYER